jgi:tryptophan halogenase
MNEGSTGPLGPEPRSTGDRRLRVVIAGGGTAGWMAAAALAATMGDVISLTLVESDAIGTIGVGESTIPPIVLFNRLLGIPEADFMRATQATFKLGIRFENWRTPGESYFHSFGVTGKDHWSAGFQHFWLHGLRNGHAHSYDDYCLELKAALAGKFAHLPEDRMNYAYQLDSGLYAAFLRARAEAAGAVRVEGRIAGVELDGESGNIAALRLEGDRRIAGDLFLDCTGFRALLIEGALHAGFDDWTHYLPCDSAIAVQTQSVRAPVPYTRAIAHDAGWQWRIPLQHRQGNGIVYCSRYLDRDAALRRLLETVEGGVLTEPNHIRYTTGARRQQWVRNCVAVGLSGGFMEPLESTSIHLIQRAVLRLIRMLPGGPISPHDIAEFNDQQLTDMEQIRDFLILHYKVTDRRDSPFWRHCAALPVPDSLAHRIALFRETGRVFRKNEELFVENSWVQVMMGQGIMPQSCHPVASRLSAAELDHFLRSQRQTVAQTVASLPSHEAYIARYCAAGDARAA